MELPKNVTQIGESDRYCKVYVEDYVISHIKQLNRQTQNKELAVALYGKHQEEDGVSYLFCYGAVRLFSLQKEVRHLSQAQNQEIEKNRKQYFGDYEFLGYRLLDGEMVEGFHICEKGVCRYIQGYACFYEKNDAMLAYMLDSRKEDVEPESVDLEKYERVKKRQEERKKQETERIQKEQKPVREQRKQSVPVPTSPVGMRRMKTVAAASFLAVCALGIAGVYYLGDREDIQTAADKLIAEFSEQKLPEREQDSASSVEETSANDVLMTEDKLTEVLQQENAASILPTSPEQSSQPAEAATIENEQPETSQPEDAQSENTQTPETPATQPQESSAQEVTSDTSVTVPSTYTIKRGDTLTEISVRLYGTDRRVKDICELNGIEDPDDIRFGQKLLLP